MSSSAFWGDVRGTRIAVWGAAFKPEVDDTRDSPALAVAQALHDLGGSVTVTDPAARDNARKPHPGLDYADDPIAATQDAGLRLHLAERPAYRHIDPVRLASRVANPKVIDARGTPTVGDWYGAGWIYRALGRPDGPGRHRSGGLRSPGPPLRCRCPGNRCPGNRRRA